MAKRKLSSLANLAKDFFGLALTQSIWWHHTDHSLCSRKLVRSSSSIGDGANERVVTNSDFIVVVWVILLEFQFSGKVGSDLGEEKPIT